MTFALVVMTKNGRQKLPKLFASVPSFISKTVVLDTGSTDGTQQWLQNQGASGLLPDGPKGAVGPTSDPAFANLILYERPFTNMSDSRNLLGGFAKGIADWLIWLDDDMSLRLTASTEEIQKQLKDADGAALKTHNSSGYQWRLLVVRGDLDWKWERTIHETIAVSGRNIVFLEGLEIIHDSQSTPEKLEWYQSMLFAELGKKPTDSYLIQRIAATLKERGDFQAALHYFLMHLSMEKEPEATFLSLFEVAQLTQNPEDMVHAFNFRPTRAEAAMWLREYFNAADDKAAAAKWEGIRASLPLPDDILFVNPACYGPSIG